MKSERLSSYLPNICLTVFFVLFMIIQRLNNVYILISYCIAASVLLYGVMRCATIPINARRLIILLLFFWFQEFTSAQENNALRIFVYGLEIIILGYLALHSFLNRRNSNRPQMKTTFFTLIALVVFNLLGCMLTYNNILIFLYSTYDSCKYFILIFYILSINPKKEDFKSFLDLLSVIVFMNTITALFQFMGQTWMFDIFRGRYKIVSRIGSFRAIGMFPYGIELGNYSAILFALYYNFGKTAKESRKKYIIVEACLFLCAIISGTRISMAIILIIVLISNISNVKGWIKTGFIVLAVLLAASNLIDIEDMIGRTKWDISIELPRTYYFTKGMEIWKDHPIFGIGYNTYGSMKYRERTGDIIFNTYNAHAFDYAQLATTDSFVAEIIPEFGLAGITVICIFAYYVFNNYRKKKEHEFYRVFFIALFSILLMSYNTSTALISAHIGSWFWIFSAMLLCSENNSVKLIYKPRGAKTVRKM